MLFLRISFFLSFCFVTLADYRQEALEEHNNFRVTHDAPAMTLNNEMNTAAEEWARELGDRRQLEHADRKTRSGHGENLYKGCSSAEGGASVQAAVQSWYNEVCEYDFSNPGYRGGTGHFTQVVWKDSTELGIGKYTGQEGSWYCTYIVARYKPAGNIISGDNFSDNVSKGSFSSSYCDSVNDKSVGNAVYLDAPEGTGSGSTD